MDEGNPLTGIAIIFLLILINAMISMMIAAYDNLAESSIKKKAEAGDEKAKAVLNLLETPVRYLHALELLLGFTGILIGCIYASSFMPRIEAVMKESNFELNLEIIRPGYYILFTSFLVFVTTLFGSVLPKKIAAKHAESVSIQTIRILKLLGWILRPFAWFLEKSMNLIFLIFGLKPNEMEDNVTEEEIISMVNEGHEQGVFDADEAEMISNIIELDEKEAQDIMTHKKRIVAINAEMSVEDALRFMISENYTRYPVYEENRDNIIGILHLKDVIGAYISDELRNKQLKEIAREPYFVPDTQNINILFHDMQSKNIHMAIVIDEYGQTAGLVAMEDFLEEIVGNIQDEYDDDEKMILAVEEDSCIVKGAISLEELEDELQITIEHEDFDTLNGLLISILDRIPADGEKEIVDYAGYQFDILETKNKMIEQVRISKLPDNKDDLVHSVVAEKL